MRTLITVLLLCGVAGCNQPPKDPSIIERATLNVQWSLMRTADTAIVYQEIMNVPVVTEAGAKLKHTYLDSLRPWALRRDSIRRVADGDRTLSGKSLAEEEPVRAAQQPSFPCDGIDVSVAVESYVKRQLASPSTADFPWYTDEFMKREGTKYTYTSYVDSQNAFGATIRTHFKAWVSCTGDQVLIHDIKYE
jgi:hypothetical protein